MIMQMLQSWWRLHWIWHTTGRKYKKSRKPKNGFPKELAENADMHKPILNKIMTPSK